MIFSTWINKVIVVFSLFYVSGTKILLFGPLERIKNLENEKFNNWFMRQGAFKSRYEAREKFGKDVRCVRGSSSFLSALQTSRVLQISMKAQLAHEPMKLS